jgi:hypothetical protein
VGQQASGRPKRLFSWKHVAWLFFSCQQLVTISLSLHKKRPSTIGRFVAVRFHRGKSHANTEFTRNLVLCARAY